MEVIRRKTILFLSTYYLCCPLHAISYDDNQLLQSCILYFIKRSQLNLFSFKSSMSLAFCRRIANNSALTISTGNGNLRQSGNKYPTA